MMPINAIIQLAKGLQCRVSKSLASKIQHTHKKKINLK